MTTVVDMMAFREARQRKAAPQPRSMLDDCLMHDTLEDLSVVVERLSECNDLESLHLTEYDKEQLDILASLSDTFLDFYELLGLNLVEEELTTQKG